MKKSLFLLLAVLILAGTTTRAEILEQILVKVNGDIITKTDLEQRQVAYLRMQNQQFRESDLQTDEGLRRALAEITPGIIVDAVDELLLVQRGRELGYRLTDEQFNSIVENIKQENRIDTDEQFQAALDAEGMTMADLRRSLERQMLISRVQQVEILAKVGISEQEARRYYETHLDEFTSPAAVTLREILIEVPTGPGGDPNQALFNVALDEQARKRAEAAHARVMAGEDFAAVAAEVSDAPSRATGGLIGPILRHELASSLLDVLQELEPGEVTEILRTPRGYHFLQLESAADATRQPFEQVRDEIAERVYEQKHRAEFERYMERLRGQAIIDWRSEELKGAYEQHIAERRSAAEATL